MRCSERTKMEILDICAECGAVGHGNMFCNTCRSVMNARHGWNLPPWPHPAEKPCGAEEVAAFKRRVRIARGEDPDADS
jgi:hypothetical protein